MGNYVPLPVQMTLFKIKATRNGRILVKIAEVQTKQNFEVFLLDFKKFIVIGTKDGKLNPAATVFMTSLSHSLILELRVEL